MKILCFTPYHAIWPHAFPEALIFESLQRSGHVIKSITCGGILNSFCVAMAANGLTPHSSVEEKNAVCIQCKKSKELVKNKFGYEAEDLETFLTEADLEYVYATLQNITKENYKSLTFEGLKIGELALYEFLISQKKGDDIFTDSEWSLYKIALRNSLFTAVASKKIIEREKPDLLMVYNSLYSTNAVFCALGTQRGIPHYFLHASPNLSYRLQHLIMAQGDSFKLIDTMKRYWLHNRNTLASAKEISIVGAHFLALLRGTSAFAYSAQLTKKKIPLRDFFSVADQQKVVVAALSSGDELFAAEKTGFFPKDLKILFPDQISWVKALTRYFADHKELFLVIRVHPREFPNKRDARKSEHAQQLEKELSHLPENVKVNWPSDEISIFELATITDLFLNCWSSAGKEMALLGIPVLTYCKDLLGYPVELNFYADTVSEYFRQLERALAAGWSFERVQLSYRWHSIEYSRVLIDISESCHLKDYADKSYFEKALIKIFKRIDSVFLQRIDCLRRKNRPTFDTIVEDLIVNRYESVLQSSLIKNQLCNETKILEMENIRKDLTKIYDLIGAENLKTKLEQHFQKTSDTGHEYPQ